MNDEHQRYLLSGTYLIGKLIEKELIESPFDVNMGGAIAALDQLGGIVQREYAVRVALDMMLRVGVDADDLEEITELLGKAYDGTLEDST